VSRRVSDDPDPTFNFAALRAPISKAIATLSLLLQSIMPTNEIIPAILADPELLAELESEEAFESTKEPPLPRQPVSQQRGQEILAESASGSAASVLRCSWLAQFPLIPYLAVVLFRILVRPRLSGDAFDNATRDQLIDAIVDSVSEYGTTFIDSSARRPSTFPYSAGLFRSYEELRTAAFMCADDIVTAGVISHPRAREIWFDRDARCIYSITRATVVATGEGSSMTDTKRILSVTMLDTMFHVAMGLPFPVGGYCPVAATPN
jgi:hypothetical protein